MYRSQPTAWIFDVDGCLVDSHTGGDLRPGAGDLLAAVRASGARTVVWSAGGAHYARDRMVAVGVAHLADDFLGKDRRGPDGRYVWEAEGDLAGLVFVDDRPEDLPAGADVIGVSPYISANPNDRGLEAALRRARNP